MSIVKIEQSENTILDEILKKGIKHKHSCLSGICGACRCKKPLTGRYKYIIEPIAVFDEDEFLPCVSVVLGDSIEIKC